MKTGTIRQKTTLKASPSEVYQMLMDSKKHSAFTGSACRIGKKEGSSYSAYDGYIVGKNIELVPDKKIVQTWRAVDGKWPEDHYSTITFSLKAKGKETELSFVQTGIPEAQVKEFISGWKDFYWTPMKNYLSGRE